VGVFDHHGLHRKTRRERSRFEGNDGFAVRRGALGKQHYVRPLVVHGPPLNMSSRMMPGLRRDSIHRYDLKKLEKSATISLNPLQKQMEFQTGTGQNGIKPTCKA